jgi:hypothetical protein
MNSRINVSAVPPYEIHSRVAYVIMDVYREMASTRSRLLRTWFLRSNSLVRHDNPQQSQSRRSYGSHHRSHPSRNGA